MITVKKFTFNPLQENTYLLYDETGSCLIVDAGCYFSYEKEELARFISDHGLRPEKLVNTHCHFDHILGITFCREKYGIPFYAHRDDAFLIEHAVGQGDVFGVPMEPLEQPEGWITEGEQVSFGNSSLEAIHVPGHAPGSLVFYTRPEKFILAGDVLFHGSIGRTDLPGGSYEQLMENIQKKLLILPDETLVYCGHGPETTIGAEKAENPFLQD
jgi:glyoxylase-like metal-dependent hydrolase (beta-lactamase superfamily II)